jgi:hypothetical protein
MHEASLHKVNWFVTLTYEKDPFTLRYSDVQQGWKRLRERVGPFRFYLGGEYGETNPYTGVVDGGLYRPHYHAVLFGIDFVDRRPLKLLGRADYFSSALLDDVWRLGNCVLGPVTFESAAYVARYCVKKRTGPGSEDHYRLVMPDGSVIQREPEFARMSLRPGIGAGWYDRYGEDVRRGDAVICRGVPVLPPRYYDKLHGRLDPEGLAEAVEARAELGDERRADHTDRRNYVRGAVLAARQQSFKRS